MTNIEKLIDRMGKEGEIMRVLWEALEYYANEEIEREYVTTYRAQEALAKAEELAKL